eukprot:6197585-Pleurochrysis_carterae.AAC.1
MEMAVVSQAQFPKQRRCVNASTNTPSAKSPSSARDEVRAGSTCAGVVSAGAVSAAAVVSPQLRVLVPHLRIFGADTQYDLGGLLVARLPLGRPELCLELGPDCISARNLSADCVQCFQTEAQKQGRTNSTILLARASSETEVEKRSVRVEG